MSVRFIIGRAGSGKTHHCIRAIQAALRESPTDGPPLILLTPEQASLQAGRSLLSGDIRACARAETLSFRRLAYRVLQSANEPERTALSAAGRAMVLRALLSDLSPQLQYYRRLEQFPGFLDRLGRTFGELIDESVRPADLRGGLGQDGFQADDPAARVRNAKLADLALIYGAYIDYLGVDRLDPSQALELARKAMADSNLYRDAYVWVDGFAGFTRLEMELLGDLAARAAHMDVTLLVDPEYHRQAGMGEDIEQDLFARPQRTWRWLLEVLGERDVEIELPLVLAPEVTPRFQKSKTLGALERNLARLLDDPAFTPPSEGDAAAPPADIALFEAPDRRTEVEYAVAQIKRMVDKADGALRYRDVAIITRDLELYHDLIAAAMAERGIPFFVDRRRSLAHHALIEFIRAALAVAAEDYSLEAMRLLLKTGLCGLDEAQADALENYLLAHGLSGRKRWTAGPWHAWRGVANDVEAESSQAAALARINAARETILGAVDGFVVAISADCTGTTFAEALRKLLDDNHVAARLEQWSLTAIGQGQPALAEEHRQAQTEVRAFVDELGQALAPASLPIEEWSRVVDSGLAQLSLALPPPTLDEVLVGSIERSRHPDIRTAFVLGFNDGVFPPRIQEDPLLNDADRKALADARVHVGVTARQRRWDEHLLVYVALTRASEKMLISYAAMDEAGKALRPSALLDMVKAACPGLVERKLGDPTHNRAWWPIVSVPDLASSLAAEFRQRTPQAEQEAKAATRARWNALYEAARRRETLHPPIAAALAGLTYRNTAALSDSAVKVLFRNPYEASVSELESFAACPFQRFARFGLRLRTRDEAALAATDVGSTHHAVLENVIRQLIGQPGSLAALDPDDIRHRLDECAQSIREGVDREGVQTSPRDAYLLGRTSRDLTPVLGEQRIALGCGEFQPVAAERMFGFRNHSESGPPLEVATPSGRRVLLRGVIDRVDLAELAGGTLGVVVDYKHTLGKRLSMAEVYHGLALQLVGYLLVLQECGEAMVGRPIEPVAALYVSLRPSYRPVTHPGSEEAEKEASKPLFTPRGLIKFERFSALSGKDPEQAPYKIRTKKDGSMGWLDQDDGAHAEDFTALLEHVRAVVGRMADRVLDGDVSVAPYRLGQKSPCVWCDMRSVCRFEFGDQNLRFLDAMKRSQVFEVLREARKKREASS